MRRRHVGHGAFAVDRADARRDVCVRQKVIHADIDEQWIAVAVLAVRAGRLHDLGHEMDVVGTVVRRPLSPPAASIMRSAWASIGPWHHGPQVKTSKSRQRTLTGSS